jgi:hypothetical protein
MKLILNIFLIFAFLVTFVPIFRKFIFHLLVGRKMVKEQKRANDAYQKAAARNTVNIDPKSNQERSSNYRGGEYIDYEEVKDK